MVMERRVKVCEIASAVGILSWNLISFHFATTTAEV
uniref:Uncharacterized protein n=1 Tax=Lepeophtheirus salmonis TaxID=72036 RepID=A0A0K2V9K3_LEPSM